MEKEQYIIFADKRFMRYAIREAAAVLGGFSEIRRSDRFVIIETDSGKDAAAKLVDLTIFINSAIPLIGAFEYKSGLAEIVGAIGKSLAPGERFRLEALNMNSKTGQSAKTIEVKIGEELESKGFTADLRNPDTDFYIIFSGDSAYLGRSAASEDHRMIDEFRRSTREGASKVSRSEFKLKEALEYFRVDVKGIKSAIDIGAAPGGWSKVMSDLGVRVLTVDSAELKYSSPLITHVRVRADRVNAETLTKFGKADILLVDTNTEPKVSAGLAAMFASNLHYGAHLILTLKFVGGDIDAHMKTVRDALSQKYTQIRFKKLPHNRLEITCFAIKK